MGIMDLVGSLMGGEKSSGDGDHVDLASVMNLLTQFTGGDSKKATVNTKALAKKVTELTKSTTDSGKKIVAAKPDDKDDGNGVDLTHIIDIVQNLASGSHEHTGAPEGKVNVNMLGSILSSLTGGTNESGGPNVDHKSVISMLAPLLAGNDGLLENLKSNPGEIVEKIVGVKLDAKSLGPILEGLGIGGKK